MRKIIPFFLLLALAASCNNEADKNEQTDTLTVEDSVVLPAERLKWHIEYDSVTGDGYLQEQADIELPDTLTAATLVQGLNTAWPEIPLVYQRTEGDTVFVNIPDSEYLTQRMGSSGPPGYLAQVTYTLTDLKGIRLVKFDFEVGDHASPGVYSRNDFRNFIRK